jgi:hypothetical protein
MSVVASAVLAAATVIEEQPLIAPSVVFPIIALSVFGLLAAVAYSYRDVANQHKSASGHGSPQGHK